MTEKSPPVNRGNLPRTKKRGHSPTPDVPPGYIGYLRRIAGERFDELAGDQWKHWAEQKGRYHAAYQIYLKIQEFIDKNTAPPLVAVEDERDYEWIALGRRLRSLDTDRYNKLRHQLRNELQAIASPTPVSDK